MKPFVFEKNSWHYWLASEIGGFNSGYYNTTDICTYTRAVLKGLLLGAIALCIISTMTWWLLITIVWWFVIAVHGFFVEPAPIVMTCIIGVVLGVIAIDRISSNISKMRKAKSSKESATNSFIGEAYYAWKNKMCTTVTLVDNADVDTDTNED